MSGLVWRRCASARMRWPAAWIAAAMVAVLVSSASLPADEAFYFVPLGELQITEGELPAAGPSPDWRWQWRRTPAPYAVVEGAAEAYLRGWSPVEPRAATAPPGTVVDGEAVQDNAGEVGLAVRSPQKLDELRGLLCLSGSEGKELTKVRFTAVAKAGAAQARRRFYEAKIAHYEALLARDLSGAAWFRHQVRVAQAALGRETAGVTPEPQTRREREGDVARTFSLFTGGRAVSENLQLDRAIELRGDGAEEVDIDSLEGITIQEIDWQPLIKDLEIDPDPLAKFVPADQHVVFFPSVRKAMQVADLVRQQGTLVTGLLEPRSQDARTLERYEAQLGLPLDELARLLGPPLVGSVAMTGSDPYFRTGTDVALLIESPQPGVLARLLAARAQAARLAGGAPPREGRIVERDNMVIVSNSQYQLERLEAVRRGEMKSIGELPEYTFFRHRYPRTEEESAFVFLSDATIRRWCGPRWRIGTSRRARQAAVLAEVQASSIDELVGGKTKPRPVSAEPPLASTESFMLERVGVVGSRTGSLEFMTPIAETPLKKVTRAEADAYAQWRDRYQRNWRWAFDPIGVRVSVEEGKVAADATVMPLIWGSEYRQFVELSRGAKITPDAGDPHGAPAHAIAAINRDSARFRQANSFVEGMGLRAALGWIGDTVGLYADDDPYWEELANVSAQDREPHLRKNLGRLPVAFRVDVASGIKLTAFLASLRTFAAQAAPDMLTWETLEHRDVAYVKVSPTERARSNVDEFENVALYYAASGKSLVVSLNENVVKRAIERELDQGDGGSEEIESPAIDRWLGESLSLVVDQRIVLPLAHLGRDEYQRLMQSRAWGNLPVLNEWRRCYPDQDPLAVHERVWRERLVCPGGGRYVWNDAWQTMESTVYGHPGEPKAGPAMPPVLNEYSNANFGLTFEEQGLRARVELHNEKAE